MSKGQQSKTAYCERRYAMKKLIDMIRKMIDNYNDICRLQMQYLVDAAKRNDWAAFCGMSEGGIVECGLC